MHRVVSLALVQLADGSREVDALIQPNNNELEPRGGERTRSQMVLASEHARDIPWVHWVLRPHPTATGPNPRRVRDPGVYGTRCSAPPYGHRTEPTLGSRPWSVWYQVLSPARLPSLLSIAPGTVRGRWVTPSLRAGRAVNGVSSRLQV